MFCLSLVIALKKKYSISIGLVLFSRIWKKGQRTAGEWSHKNSNDLLSKPAYPSSLLSDRGERRRVKSEKSEKRQQSGANCWILSLSVSLPPSSLNTRMSKPGDEVRGQEGNESHGPHVPRWPPLRSALGLKDKKSHESDMVPLTLCGKTRVSCIFLNE